MYTARYISFCVFALLIKLTTIFMPDTITFLVYATPHFAVSDLCLEDSSGLNPLDYKAGMCTRPSEPRPRRDRDETLQLPRHWPKPWISRDSRDAETFSVAYGETHWQWKNYRD